MIAFVRDCKLKKIVMLFILKILSWLSDRIVENVEACSEKEGLMLKLFKGGGATQRSVRRAAAPGVLCTAFTDHSAVREL